MSAIISTENYADSATITGYLGTYSLPLSELKKPWGRGLCRGATSGFATIAYNVDLGAERDISTIACIGLNGTATMTVYVSSSNSYSGDIHQEAVEYSTDWRLGPTAVCYLHADAAPWTARYVRIRIDVTEDGATYVDQRRLWIGGGLMLPEGVSRGWRIRAVDGSVIERTAQGGVYVDDRTKWKRVTAGRSRVSLAQCIGDGPGVRGLYTEIAGVGRGGEVLAALRSNVGTSAETHRIRCWESVYGQLIEWSDVQHRAGQYFAMDSMVIEEAPLPIL